MELSQYADTDFRLWVLLARTRDTLLKARKNELSRYGVSAIEALALFVLNDLNEATTPAELSRRMARQHNTVTALLRRMEKKRFIRMVRDSEKLNTWRVSLTQGGKTACHQASSFGSLHKAMSGLSDPQKQELESCLRSINDNALKQLTIESVFP